MTTLTTLTTTPYCRSKGRGITRTLKLEKSIKLLKKIPC